VKFSSRNRSNPHYVTPEVKIPPARRTGAIKALIAVFCCHKYRSWAQTIRDTWAKDAPVDVKFFLGRPTGDAPQPDEVFLDADDSQEGRSQKLIEVYKWALAHGYTHVFRCDPDTFVRPALLMKCGFEQHDYMGGLNSFFASGGSGFWLSERAMQIVTATPSDNPADDVEVALRLKPYGIELHDDSRFRYYPGAALDSQTVAYHLSSVKGWNAGATQDDIRRAHAGTFRLNDGVMIDAAVATEGWMDLPDLTFLAEQAKKHTGIIEVGSWMGRSTRALADNTIGIVHCVDTWKGSGLEHDPWLRGKSEGWLFEQFKKNTAGCANLRLFQMTSLEGAAHIKNLQETSDKVSAAFDMIFIDASHDYENVKADILAWKPLLKQGGMFCGHDYQDCWPDVIKAVHELLTDVKVVPGGSIWYTES
jgi:Methyltransferase domain